MMSQQFGSCSSVMILEGTTFRNSIAAKYIVPYSFEAKLVSCNRPFLAAGSAVRKAITCMADIRCVCQVDSSSSTRMQRILVWLKRQALRFFLMGYPWLNAFWEGSRFGFQLHYLLNSSAFYSPELWLLGQSIARVSGTELVRFHHLTTTCTSKQSAPQHACVITRELQKALGLPGFCRSWILSE